jgi:thymidylate kinase
MGDPEVSAHSRNRAPGSKGFFLVVVGPDGAGKTSLARTLLRRSEVDGVYFHFIPTSRTRLAEEPPGHEELVEKQRGSGSRLLGVLRIGRNLARAWLGYLLAIRPALRSGKVVIGDRWLYGYLAQPQALRFHGPSWIARLVLQAMPRPDLVVLLDAPPETIHERKPELMPDEIRDEIARWRAIDGSVLRLDATGSPDHLASVVMAHVCPRTEFVRYPPTLGHVLLPSRPRAVTLAGSSLYAATRRRAYLGHRIGRALIQVLGASWLPPASVDHLPLDAETWAALVESLRDDGLRFDDVALYTPTQEARGNFALLLIDGGVPRAFVRVGSPAGLEAECLAVSFLETSQPQAFDFPRLLARGSIGTTDYAAFTIVLDGLHKPAGSPPVERILAEIQNSLHQLPQPPDMPAPWEPMHGDFTPWNLREAAVGRGPILIDWESAGWGPSGADAVLHYAASRALGLPVPPQPPNPEAARYWMEHIEPTDSARDARLSEGLRRALEALEQE